MPYDPPDFSEIDGLQAALPEIGTPVATVTAEKLNDIGAGASGAQDTADDALDAAAAASVIAAAAQAAASDATDAVGLIAADVLTGGSATPTVASATTITLPDDPVVKISGTATITSITASWAGRRVTLIFTGALTLTDGSNLKLAGDFVTVVDDAITLACDGSSWFEC